MHCHSNLAENLNIPHNKRKVLLVGNPNTGKSVVFNALTGLYVDVSNFPGTTIDVSYAPVSNDIIIDTPGIYGVSSFNDEERVARDIILEGDVVINIVNSVHLERDLFLTLQLIDMQVPMVVGLNMMDEAERCGVSIDVEALSRILGVPVVPLVAVTGIGISDLKKAVDAARPGNTDPALSSELEPLLRRVGDRRRALLILENDSDLEKEHNVSVAHRQTEIYAKRRERVNALIKAVVQENPRRNRISALLSHIVLHPVTGIPILAGILYLLYQLVGVFVAGTVVGFTEEVVMQSYYEPAIRAVVTRIINPTTVLGTLLIGEFGLLTMTVTYLFGLLLPLVIGFYLALSIMEDSGYLPRLAALVDRVFTFFGLNGRAVIPVILGFGCVTMATMTTRILGSKRERTIATILLALSIPCSAQLGVIIGMLGRAGTGYALIYVGVIAGVFGLIGVFLNRILPGTSSDLLIDLPPLRRPRLKNVFQKTFSKSVNFLREAAPLFFAGSFLIGILQVSGLLEAIQAFLAPVTVGWLQLPRETAAAFIMGIIRRDFGAAGLNALPLTPAQIVVSLVTLTLFVPCIASIIVILKERSIKEGLAIIVSCFSLAFLVGGLVSQVLM